MNKEHKHNHIFVESKNKNTDKGFTSYYLFICACGDKKIVEHLWKEIE